MEEKESFDDKNTSNLIQEYFCYRNAQTNEYHVKNSNLEATGRIPGLRARKRLVIFICRSNFNGTKVLLMCS